MKISGRIQIFILTLAVSLSVMALETPKFYLRGHLEMLRKTSGTTATRTAKLNALFPESIRKNIVYSLWANSTWYFTKNVSDYSSFIDDNYFELCKRMDSTGISFVVNVGELNRDVLPMPEPPATFTAGTGSYYITPAQMDKVFANTKNCVGISSGENFWTYNTTVTNAVLDLLRVCKKYNKKYILADGGWGYSSYLRFLNDNYDALKNEGLGKYLVPMYKTTKPYAAFVTQGAVMGAWVTGLTDSYGTWDDEWAWTYSSFRNANEFPIYTKADNTYTLIPFTHYLKAWLLTIAAGGDANYMETALFGRDAVPDANQTPYWLPFIKGLAEHNIMPSKAAVLAKVKAIANPYGTYTLSNGTTAQYNTTNLVSYQTTVVPYNPTSISTYADPYGLLYKNTYGIWNDTAYTNTGTVTDRFYANVKTATGQNYLLNAVVREVLPNNPRYLLIPLLPHVNDAASVPAGIENLALNTLATDDAVKTKFESLYPATPNDNGAWAQEIDNSFFVINSNENADIDQNFTFTLGNSIIESLSGIMPFQNFMFGKREGVDNYWFQSNGYAVANGTSSGQKYVCTAKKTTLRFKCKYQPKIRVEDGKTGYIQKSWDAVNHVFQLQIDHSAGAVNFRIYFNPDDKPCFVRSLNDSISWKQQAQQNPERVLNVSNISELAKQLNSSTFYLAQGEYSCDNAFLSDSMNVFGGFRGDESQADINQRERMDLDNNGLTEPWEFKNPTILRGIAANKNICSAKSLIIDSNATLDGFTFKGITGTGDNGLITVGTSHPVGTSTLSLTKGHLINVIIDGLKSTYGRGIVMMTSGSEVSNCLFQNDTISSAYGGGMVYLATSGGVLKNSVIRNCLSNGTSSRGGALCADIPKGNQTKEFLIQNCLIYNNKADNGAVLREDAYGITGTPETTLGCQFVNCTLFNNYSPTGNALIDVNAVTSKMVNTLVYSEQHDAFRCLYSGLMTVSNCVTNKAISAATAASSGNVVEASLANYKFNRPFSKTYSIVDRKSADYASLTGAGYLIQDNSSVAVTNKGLESMASLIPTGTANIIPASDLYNFTRPTGAYTLGAFQLGTQTGYIAGLNSAKASVLQLFPNPATDFIEIQADEATHVSFYNLAGILVKELNVSDLQKKVNVTQMIQGSYIVKTVASGQLKTVLLVKK